MLLACGSRTGIEPAVVVEVSTRDATVVGDTACPPSPAPSVLVSLTNPATPGGPSFAMTGDSSRLYTVVFGENNPAMYRVLSIDPCSGANVTFGSTTYQAWLATDGASVYFLSEGDAGTATVVRSDPLGQSLDVAAQLGTDTITSLTVFGGRGYAVDGTFALVTLALDGSGPTTLVPPLGNDMIRVWWNGAAVDSEDAYYYSDKGVEKVPVGGGATTVLFEDQGDSACGGSEPPPDPIVLVDTTNVYVSGANGILRVAKDGSANGTYAAAARPCGPLAQDETYLYFEGTAGLSRVPKVGGSVQVLAPDSDLGGIVVTGTRIYWLVFANAVKRMDKP
jgi:hypothetical protein